MRGTGPNHSLDRGGPACGLCPLNWVKSGLAVRVKKLLAAPEVAHRLREIGFCEGSVIKLLSSQANVICLVCNARLALSYALAESILVEPLAGSDVA